MQVGDVVHLDGLKAEYSLFGRDRFCACTLPDGDYVIVGFEDEYINLAKKNSWADRAAVFNKILKDGLSIY